jgi:hypothetical protein
MRLVLILSLIYCGSVFAQTKKSILKEIASHKKNIYKTAQYKDNLQELSFAIRNYFANDGFSQNNEKNSFVLTFSKKGYLACNVPNPKFNKHNYGGTRSKCKVTFYVSTIFSEANGYQKLDIETRVEEYNQPFNKNIYQKNTIGTYKFDKNSLYRYMYKQFLSKDKIPLPKGLKNKITNYNNKQSKAEKKLIVGRDY